MVRRLRMPSCFFFLTNFFLFFLLLLQDITDAGVSALSRLDFPPDFVFGAGVSAYQHEGAAAEDGRKPSIWDTFVHQGKTYDKGTGDIAADQYHNYKEDVKLMHKMGLEAYRFSISWSRLIPDGNGAVNPKGLNYYNNLINELVRYGIEPHVTLNHFDYPQALQDEYKGFESRKFIEDFTAYADVCFKEFGDRVKTWMTFNEPNVVGFGFTGGYSPYGGNCSVCFPIPRPYEASHNMILSHVAAVHLYRTKYQVKQKGQIGITLLAFWYEPVTNSSPDIAATDEKLAFSIDWFMEPIVYGRYPAIMRRGLGSQLPHFTEKETILLKGSYDFIGLNHYMVIKVDQNSATISGHEDGSSLPKLMGYIKEKYQNPTVFIHENGYATEGDDPSNPASYNDTERIVCLHKNIQSMLPIIRNGTNLKGYFVWTFLDGLEIYGGYEQHFGLYGVDFSDRNRRRYPRLSSYWYTSFLTKNGRKAETSSLLFAQ